MLLHVHRTTTQNAQHTHRSGEAAADAAAALAARQSQELQSCVAELYASSEIVKQGEMFEWDAKSSDWLRGHAVLTRQGFLHWIKCSGEGSGEDSLLDHRDVFSLARCVRV